MVLLQARNQLHGGAQGVLPGHRGANYRRCIKRSWRRRRRRNNGTIGLTIYSPWPRWSKHGISAKEYHELMTDKIDDVPESRFKALEEIEREKVKIAKEYNKRVMEK
jgi:hypothetical protein